jgi:hypothetical protein
MWFFNVLEFIIGAVVTIKQYCVDYSFFAMSPANTTPLDENVLGTLRYQGTTDEHKRKTLYTDLIAVPILSRSITH